MERPCVQISVERKNQSNLYKDVKEYFSDAELQEACKKVVKDTAKTVAKVEAIIKRNAFEKKAKISALSVAADKMKIGKKCIVLTETCLQELKLIDYKIQRMYYNFSLISIWGYG